MMAYAIVLGALLFGVFGGYNLQNSSEWKVFVIVVAIFSALALSAIIHPAKLGDVMIWLGLYDEPADSKYDDEPTVSLFEDD
jgi:hypothetical protein